MWESKLCNTPLKQVKFRDPDNFKPLEEIYLGVKVGIELRSREFDSQEVKKKKKKKNRLRCLDFLNKAVSQICKVFFWIWTSGVFESSKSEGGVF